MSHSEKCGRGPTRQACSWADCRRNVCVTGRCSAETDGQCAQGMERTVVLRMNHGCSNHRSGPCLARLAFTVRENDEAPQRQRYLRGHDSYSRIQGPLWWDFAGTEKLAQLHTITRRGKPRPGAGGGGAWKITRRRPRGFGQISLMGFTLKASRGEKMSPGGGRVPLQV